MSHVTSSSLAFSSLDALPTQLAILDEDGVIVYTNRAWQEFGNEHGYQGDSSSVGMNYLASATSAPTPTRRRPARASAPSSTTTETSFPSNTPARRPKSASGSPCGRLDSPTTARRTFKSHTSTSPTESARNWRPKRRPSASGISRGCSRTTSETRFRSPSATSNRSSTTWSPPTDSNRSPARSTGWTTSSPTRWCWPATTRSRSSRPSTSKRARRPRGSTSTPARPTSSSPTPSSSARTRVCWDTCSRTCFGTPWNTVPRAVGILSTTLSNTVPRATRLRLVTPSSTARATT
ncbi:HTR-like protein [Haloferax sp. BAB-2207]|nr:HTR-like protein [Haloferax sp. BAB-2207]